MANNPNAILPSTAANTTPVTRPSTAKDTPGQAAMELHHEALISMAFDIYNTYLAPSSRCELNIDHSLRNELVSYLNDTVFGPSGKTFQGPVGPEKASNVNATQLQHMIYLYGRIQQHVFRLMATDSVPKFTKTPRFVELYSELRAGRDEYEDDDDDSITGPLAPPGLDGVSEMGGRTFLSVSNAANERIMKSRPAQNGSGSGPDPR